MSEEYHCKACNTVYPGPRKLSDLVCKCGGILSPSSQMQRMLEETIRTQQATIEGLTEQRDRLLKIVSSMSDADICNSQHHDKKHRHCHADDCPIVKIIKALIAEIEASND